MADQLLPTSRVQPANELQLQSWQDLSPAPSVPKSPIERPLAAVRRYKWLIVAIVLVAIGGGVVATRFLTPAYEVQARLMITSDGGSADSRSGPIRSPGLVNPDDWAQLLRTFTIADAVVRKLSLYLQPANSADAPLFKGFTLADAYAAGQFELTIDRTRKRWTLAVRPSGTLADSGAAVDSVGRKLGFQWQVPAWAFAGAGENKVKFTVATPRETAKALIDRLQMPARAPESNFLRLSLEDPDRQLAANILNTWLREFIDVAADLKKKKLTDFANTLAGQLTTAKMSLDSAEVELQTLRVRTIVLPSEGGPVSAGLQETRDPVIKEYFNKKIEYDDIRRDAQLLRSLMAAVARDSLPSDALLLISTVASGAPVAQALRTAVADYHGARANLAVARQKYQDEHPDVKALIAQVNSLKNEKIPQYASDLLASLRVREVADSVRIASETVNLEQIPQRTIEEDRLRRRRDIASGLYTDLQNRFAAAQLAEASATPDIRILDTAIAPLAPTKNTAPKVMLMALAGGIGGALALAILLDSMDGRLRYPEQATDELGLPIAGTVPRFPKAGVNQDSPEQMFQLVESFRTLRMSVVNANGDGPISIAVSSPAPGEGKSLISANLAMSFADAGLRTVLVDGDTRRGALHEMFEMASTPGLTDILVGGVSLAEITRPTSHEALTVITCGTRRRRSPELLTSPQLVALVAQLRANYDVVIFDTPPLAAGIDGYSIATATGNLLVVLRVGQTIRRLAAEKLRMFERLPVSVVGAVLNGIQAHGEYGYYGYVAGYEARDADGSSSGVVALR